MVINLSYWIEIIVFENNVLDSYWDKIHVLER
jgi:hypothetical protein